MNWVFEAIGIIGTFFILISFLTNNVKKLRILNIVGSAIFVVYGVLIGAISTYVMNAAMVVVNIIYLIKDRKQK